MCKVLLWLLVGGAVLTFAAFWASQPTGSETGIGLGGGRIGAMTVRREASSILSRKMFMEYKETYHGQCIIITTLQHADSDWTSKAELLLDTGTRMPIAGGSDNRYQSEEEARQAALSVAAGAIDRARISRGKP